MTTTPCSGSACNHLQNVAASCDLDTVDFFGQVLRAPTFWVLLMHDMQEFIFGCAFACCGLGLSNVFARGSFLRKHASGEHVATRALSEGRRTH